jgi:hypothetical protein
MAGPIYAGRCRLFETGCGMQLRWIERSEGMRRKRVSMQPENNAFDDECRSRPGCYDAVMKEARGARMLRVELFLWVIMKRVVANLIMNARSSLWRGPTWCLRGRPAKRSPGDQHVLGGVTVDLIQLFVYRARQDRTSRDNQ